MIERKAIEEAKKGYQGLDELKDLMQDSVISMANLSEIETTHKESHHTMKVVASDVEVEILAKYEAMKKEKE